MSRGGAGKACAKRVAPPAVPEALAAAHRHSGSSFGSQGYASCEEPPPDTPSHSSRDDHSDYGSTVSGASGMSLGRSPGGGSFTFPAQPLTHKAAVYYHHQLALSDDQGIDMTQSPGRDSPGSSSGSGGSGSRHSSASLDSGRASSGRNDAAELVHRMLLQGRPESEIFQSWLCELQLEEYWRLLCGAGYDLATAVRMTPEDLTAVGVRKPAHRKRLKAELAALRVPDALPDYIPGSLEEWLRLLRLEEHAPALVSQGYRTVHHATQLAWEDLEDMGIVRLGHQKKILLAIKRVKDIRAGKGQHAQAPPWEREAPPRSAPAPPHDLLSIQLRGKSLESLEDLESPPAFPPPWQEDSEAGGTLPRHRGPVRSRPVAKVLGSSRGGTLEEERRLQTAACGASPHVSRKPPPEPPRRRRLTTAEVHHPALALPALPRSDSLSVCLDSAGLLSPAPGLLSPAPGLLSPAPDNTAHRFQLSSSTDSDSIPFANENAGTIKQNRTRDFPYAPAAESADVLSDIGYMLATLTDELDAMLEDEKRQGLANS